MCPHMDTHKQAHMHPHTHPHTQVRAREEKAVAEAQALEQRLKLQRVELTRQAHAIQNMEDKSRMEIYQVQVGAGRRLPRSCAPSLEQGGGGAPSLRDTQTQRGW